MVVKLCKLWVAAVFHTSFIRLYISRFDVLQPFRQILVQMSNLVLLFIVKIHILKNDRKKERERINYIFLARIHSHVIKHLRSGNVFPFSFSERCCQAANVGVRHNRFPRTGARTWNYPIANRRPGNQEIAREKILSDF